MDNMPKRPTPPPGNNKKGPEDDKNNLFKQIFIWIIAIVFMAHLALLFDSPKNNDLTYSEFYNALENNDVTQAISSVVQVENRLEVVYQRDGG